MQHNKIKIRLLAICLIAMCAFPAYAGAADELIDLLELLMGYIQKAGCVLVAYGLGKMLLAFKDDNAESKARGAMIMLAGVFCVVIKTILTALGALP